MRAGLELVGVMLSAEGLRQLSAAAEAVATTVDLAADAVLVDTAAEAVAPKDPITKGDAVPEMVVNVLRTRRPGLVPLRRRKQRSWTRSSTGMNGG